MVRSVAIKLGLLALTLALVWWIGWVAPEPLQESLIVSADETTAIPARAPVEGDPKSSWPDETKERATWAQPGNERGEAAGPLPARRVLDLNRADAEALESLPGIGPVLAQRVIAYRKSVGRFRSIEDLRRVKGIGMKTFQRIKPLVTIGGYDRKSQPEKRPL